MKNISKFKKLHFVLFLLEVFLIFSKFSKIKRLKQSKKNTILKIFKNQTSFKFCKDLTYFKPFGSQKHPKSKTIFLYLFNTWNHRRKKATMLAKWRFQTYFELSEACPFNWEAGPFNQRPAPDKLKEAWPWHHGHRSNL